MIWTRLRLVTGGVSVSGWQCMFVLQPADRTGLTNQKIGNFCCDRGQLSAGWQSGGQVYWFSYAQNSILSGRGAGF